MRSTPLRRILRGGVAAAALTGALLLTGAPAASAAPPAAAVATVATSVAAGPVAPTAPTDPGAPAAPGEVRISVGGGDGPGGKPSQSIVIILAMTVLSVAPALLLLTTSFTKILVVLGITRNALGLTGSPPNQVLAGLALFLTFFIMSPTLTAINDTAIKPYMAGGVSATDAFNTGSQPLKEFMLKQTRKEELALITKAAKRPLPENRAEVPLSTLVPAFALSELRSAFIIGFVIFIPFLVIDIVVSAALMSLGMMMLPPITVSLPFKLLLFVLVDGWGLIIKALVSSYTG
ncbi:hypothetical protein NUM3379_01250 [Kineococcus sp. NUM-3379]